MNTRYLPFFVVFFIHFAINLNAQHFLQTQGKAIVNEMGDSIILRGMGLGGWMLQEGYMLQTAEFANAQYQIKNKVKELVGEDGMNTFYDAWLTNHVRKIDIDSLKAWGFNSVRLPMHYNLFTLPIEEEPVEGVNTWLTKGFELTDSLISWCKQNEMYVILDMHAAPGGQGYDQGISDYDPTKPSIWESVPNRNKAASLWRRLAERYADEQWVAGYDLLNEPNWNLGANTVLRTVYKQMTDSIRSVDPNHILFIEGNWFANDFTGLTPPWDDNFVYSPHKYWSVNDQASIQWVLDLRETYDVPLYLGESGENSNTWFRDAIRLLEDNQIGWAWWPMKKVESIAGPLSIEKTPEYESLLDYWKGTGSTPTPEFALAALMDLTEKLKLENCTYQRDVIDAMFRQVYSDETIPYHTQQIPGVVYATDFDIGVVGEAYFDTDLANYNVTTGNYTAWNTGWAYRNDGVDIERTMDNVNTNGYSVGWLASGEWMQYDVNVANTAVYEVHIRVAANGSNGKIRLSASGADVTPIIDVANTGGWQDWETIVIPDVILNDSDKKIRFYCIEEGYNLNSLEFIETGVTTELATSFVSAITLDEQTVQLNVNKSLAGPLPANPAGFQIFVNNASIPITNTVLDAANPRIISFTVNHEFKSNELIKISYNDNQINALDGTSLTNFSLEPVQNTISSTHPIPGRIQAEDFFFQSGLVLENTTDVGAGQNVGFIDAGDYLDYYVDVTQTGIYNVSYRTAAESEIGALELQLVDENGVATTLHSVDFEATGGWQTWQTTSASAGLFNLGRQHLRIAFTKPLFNLNWFEFDFLTNTTEGIHGENTFQLFPNPNKGLFTIQAELLDPQDLDLRIYNVLGEIIWHKQMESVEQLAETIDLTKAQNGYYLVQIQLEDGTIQTRKIVKF